MLRKGYLLGKRVAGVATKISNFKWDSCYACENLENVIVIRVVCELEIPVMKVEKV